MNNKKTIIILILILTIGIVGLTIAYFSNSSTITNTFNTNPYGTTVTEEFVSPDNWLPGTKTDKSLTVTNSGQVDEAVRISYTEVWTSKTAKNNNEEGDLPLQQNGNTAALIHFTNTDDWTTVTENGTTYRYYNYKLVPNNTTSKLLDYVTFNPAITNSSNCTTNETNGTKTITCNSTGTGYDDATYKLTFTIETVQYDKYKEAWNTNINITSMKPMNASELALKSNPISVTNYTDGNVHEMYTFHHDATEQTDELTDYRYIGNDPYNYVYFNCDDLSNQNSETCEVWRIIGVFDVDNGNGNWETRIKLVRGNALPERMAWDTRNSELSTSGNFGKNEWVGSTIQTYLNDNGEYYTRSGSASNYGLKTAAKNLINDAKYYLGGMHKDNSNDYGTAEEMYSFERGTEVFSYGTYCLYHNTNNSKCITENYCENNPNDDICNATRSIFWVGKVALMYPSDYSLVYGNLVDNNCYNNPYMCYEKEYQPWNGQYVVIDNPGYPETGWIYNSNILEGQDNYYNNWLLSPYSGHSSIVFQSGEIIFGGNSASVIMGIRPTLYLSSSVKITDGDGSSSNPYKLSL